MKLLLILIKSYKILVCRFELLADNLRPVEYWQGLMPRKPSQASARAGLSADFLRSFQADFRAHGKEVIERMRQESPAKYAEIASRLIAASDPPMENSFAKCNSMREIGHRLLVSVGVSEPSDEMVDLAIIANDNFVARLEEIAGTKRDLN